LRLSGVWPATRWTDSAAESSKTFTLTAAARAHPLYSARRRTLHTGTDLLTDKKKQRLETLFATDEHLEVEATWGVYQPMIAAYREPGAGR
jgi:hypothetical protein